MASRHDYSETDDVTELAYLVGAFEDLNSCILSLCLELVPTSNPPRLLLIVTANTTKDADAARVPSASCRLNLSQLGYKRIKDACMYALYQIDGQLARSEFDRLLNNSRSRGDT